jgi:hypothetical protein
MAKVIRLDRSKPFAECRGERTPDDPHYRVHFVQTFKMGKKSVQLFFGADDALVPDDKKTEPWQGLVDGKPATFYPLYNDDMRACISKLLERADEEPEEDDDDVEIVGSDDEESASKSIDLKGWLRGQFPLTLNVVRAAMKAQFGKNPTQLKEAVTDLVLDERIVPENQVCGSLAKYLPKS